MICQPFFCSYTIVNKKKTDQGMYCLGLLLS